MRAGVFRENGQRETDRHGEVNSSFSQFCERYTVNRIACQLTETLKVYCRVHSARHRMNTNEFVRKYVDQLHKRKCSVTLTNGSYKNLSLSAATLQLQQNLLPADAFQTQVPPGWRLKRLNVVHRVYLFIPRHHSNKYRLFSWTSVTGWSL